MAYKKILYSDKYYDNQYEYRHVILPQEIARKVPKEDLLQEDRWRALGICMSRYVYFIFSDNRPVVGFIMEVIARSRTFCFFVDDLMGRIRVFMPSKEFENGRLRIPPLKWILIISL